MDDLVQHEKIGQSGNIGQIELAHSGSSNKTLKLDKHGLPMVPQPSDHEDDPLVSIPIELHASEADHLRTGQPGRRHI